MCSGIKFLLLLLLLFLIYIIDDVVLWIYYYYYSEYNNNNNMESSFLILFIIINKTINSVLFLFWKLNVITYYWFRVLNTITTIFIITHVYYI